VEQIGPNEFTVDQITNKFLVDNGIEHVGQIDPGSIEEWITGLKSTGKSADTLHTYARVVRTFW
jgi:hypothetical protein